MMKALPTERTDAEAVWHWHTLNEWQVTEIETTILFFLIVISTACLFISFSQGWDGWAVCGCGGRRANKGNTLHLHSLWNRKSAEVLSERFTSSWHSFSLPWGDTYVLFFFFCSAELTLAVLGSVYEWILSRGESLQVGCHLAAESLSGYSWSPDPRLGLSVWA